MGNIGSSPTDNNWYCQSVFADTAFIHLYLLYKRGYLIFKVDINIQKTLCKFGIPLLPHSLSY